MISICLPSRKKDNLSSNLEGLLNSIIEYSTTEELSKLEIIIKFDDDDEIPTKIQKQNFPFPIKYIVTPRGSGRWEMDRNFSYLSTLRDNKSKFIIGMSDDFLIKRPFINEVLSYSIDNTYKILGGATRGHGEQAGGDANIFLDDYISIPLGARYDSFYQWGNCIAAYCPIIGSQIADCIISLGLIPSYDASFISLALAVYQLYNINIWHNLKSFYYRNESKEYYHPSMSIIPEYHKGIYKFNTMDFVQYKDYNSKIWNIISHQAKNIYLNMKEDKCI